MIETLYYWSIIAAVLLFLCSMIFFTYQFAKGFHVAFTNCLTPPRLLGELIRQSIWVLITCWIFICAIWIFVLLFYTLLFGILAIPIDYIFSRIGFSFDWTATTAIFSVVTSSLSVFGALMVPDDLSKTKSGFNPLAFYGYIILNLFNVQYNSAFRSYHTKTGCYSFNAHDRLLYDFVTKNENNGSISSIENAVVNQPNNQWITIPSDIRTTLGLADYTPSIFTVPVARSVSLFMIIALAGAILVDFQSMQKSTYGLILIVSANFVFGAIFSLNSELRTFAIVCLSLAFISGLIPKKGASRFFVGVICIYLLASYLSLDPALKALKTLWPVWAAAIVKDSFMAGIDAALQRWVPLIKLIKDFSLVNLVGISVALWISITGIFTYLALWSATGRLFFCNEILRPSIFGPIKKNTDGIDQLKADYTNIQLMISLKGNVEAFLRRARN